jgi:hypothetical protein
MPGKQFIMLLFTSALLVNLGHNIIPHHHHYDSIISHQDCQEYDDMNALQEDDPVSHCHSFNGMEFFPAPSKNKLDTPSNRVTGNYLTDLIHFDYTHSFQKSQYDSRGSPSFQARIFGTTPGLRAPPSSS